MNAYTIEYISGYPLNPSAVKQTIHYYSPSISRAIEFFSVDFLPKATILSVKLVEFNSKCISTEK
jgi:hypothetical protein